MESYTTRADMLKHVKLLKFDQVSKLLLLSTFFVEFLSCVSSFKEEAGCIIARAGKGQANTYPKHL